MKLALVLAAFLVAACATGDDAAMQQANQECRARGLDPASAAFKACVERVSNAIYISWGRDLPSPGG